MFNRVSAVVLFVQDFASNLAFYRDILGLELLQLEEKFAAFRMHEQDFALLEVADGADMLGLALDDFTPLHSRTKRILLCTRVPDVDVVYEAYRAKGVVFSKPPTDQYWGIRAAYFQDPEGNVWEIAHSLAA